MTMNSFQYIVSFSCILQVAHALHCWRSQVFSLHCWVLWPHSRFRTCIYPTTHMLDSDLLNTCTSKYDTWHASHQKTLRWKSSSCKFDEVDIFIGSPMSLW